MLHLQVLKPFNNTTYFCYQHILCYFLIRQLW